VLQRLLSHCITHRVTPLFGGPFRRLGVLFAWTPSVDVTPLQCFVANLYFLASRCCFPCIESVDLLRVVIRSPLVTPLQKHPPMSRNALPQDAFPAFSQPTLFFRGQDTPLSFLLFPAFYDASLLQRRIWCFPRPRGLSRPPYL